MAIIDSIEQRMNKIIIVNKPIGKATIVIPDLDSLHNKSSTTQYR